MKNLTVCQEDLLRVILPAEAIPDLAKVSKVKGEVTYVLRRNLKVWGTPNSKEPITIDGYFLVNERGDINQVQPGKELTWFVTAEDLVDLLRRSWAIEDAG